MEYLVPAELRDAGGQALAEFSMPRAAASAEPWLTFLTPDDVAGRLASCGMAVLDDVGRREQIDGSLWSRSDALVPHRLGRIVHARVEGDG